MSTRSNTTSFLMGLVLALSSLAVGFFGARTVQAQSCPPDVVFGCNLSGSLGGGTGWRVTNSSTANASVAILGYASGNSGVTYGLNAQSNSPNGYGSYVVAAATSGTNYGLYGVTNSPSGYALYGVNTATSSSNAVAILGRSSNSFGKGVVGTGTGSNSIGVQGNGSLRGVEGFADPSGTGVFGQGLIGIYGQTTNTGSSAVGVFGNVTGSSNSSAAVRGDNPSSTGYAGYFQGRVHVNGNLSKSSGSFLIDHPLDPANKYLAHSFVESPDMMNVYNGNVVLDEQGEAIVELPAYFETLNREFRYQLTAIGAPGPNLYIAEEIKGNQFKIAGGEPGAKVSWQVTGIRQDPYARENPIVVEEDKPAHERGTYLYPEGYGKPESARLGYEVTERANDLNAQQPQQVTTP